MNFGWLWCVNVGSSLVEHVPFWWMFLITGEAMHMGGWGLYGKSLHLPLNFVVNLKLLLQNKALQKPYS